MDDYFSLSRQNFKGTVENQTCQYHVITFLQSFCMSISRNYIYSPSKYYTILYIRIELAGLDILFSHEQC